MTDSIIVRGLCQAITQLKQQEDRVNKDRVILEQQLIQVLAFAKAEGSETKHEGNFKVTFTAKLNRSLDEKAWLAIRDSIPAQMRPVEEKTTFKLIDKGCRYLELNEPELYAQISKALTVKPAKVSVKIEVVA